MGLSVRTVAVYLMRVGQFHEYCISTELEHDKLSPKALGAMVNSYCDYLEEARMLKESSINCTLTSLAAFFTVAGTKLPKVCRRKVDYSVRVLEPADEERLIHEILGYPSAKFKAIAVLPLFAGLKIGEVRMLKMTDLNLLDDPYVRVGARRVPLNLKCRVALLEWVNKRSSQSSYLNSDVLFPNASGLPMSTSSIDSAIRTVARCARVNVSAGMLRNIFIRSLLERKTDLSLVAYLAGFQRLDSMIRFFELAGLQPPGHTNLKSPDMFDFNVEAPYVVAAQPHAHENECGGFDSGLIRQTTF